MYVVSLMPESSDAVTVTLAVTALVVPTTTGLPPLTTTLSIVMSPEPPSSAWAVVLPMAVATRATLVPSRARRVDARMHVPHEVLVKFLIGRRESNALAKGSPPSCSSTSARKFVGDPSEVEGDSGADR